MPGIGIGFAGVARTARASLPSALSADNSIYARFKSASNNSSGTQTCIVNKPAGTVSGDVLVASWASRADITDVAMVLPSGWVKAAYLDADTPTIKVAYKVCGGSEPATYTFDAGSTVAHSVAISRYAGVDNSTPMDATATTNSGTSGTTMTAPSITTVTTNAMLVCCFANAVVSSTAITDPSDMDERNAVTSQCRNTMSDALQAAAGASGTKIATQGATARWVAATVALRPAVVVGAPGADVTITIGGSPLLTSKFMPGVSFVKNPVFFNTAGWNNAKVALANSLGIANLHLMNFGMGDPWTLNNPTGWEDGVVTVPAPSTPNRLTGANNRVAGAIAKMQEMRTTNPDMEFMFTLYNYPWWQKGILANNATSVYPIPIAASPDYDSFTDQGRIMYQNLAYFKLLTKEAAKIVMAAPYNVRWFQVWNEAKGFFNNREDISQKYEMDFLPGDTANGKVELGYGYVYIEACAALLEAADELSIDPSELMIGGPYTNMRTNGNKTSETLPASGYAQLYDRPYGTWKKAATQGIETFLDNIEDAVADAVTDERLPPGTTVDDIFHFLCFDFGPGNTDDVYLTSDPWVTVTKYTDLMLWANAELAAHGMSSKPIVGSEVYKYVPNIDLDTADAQLLLAFATEVYARLLLGGLTYPLAWGSDSEASDTTNTADWMITSPLTAGGGIQLEWGEINGWFKDHFGPGTAIYEVTSDDDSVFGIASATHLLLVHHEPTDRNVSIGGTLYPFTGHEVRLMVR